MCFMLDLNLVKLSMGVDFICCSATVIFSFLSFVEGLLHEYLL